MTTQLVSLSRSTMESVPQTIYLAGTIYTERPDSYWKTQFRDLMSRLSVTTIDPCPSMECSDLDVLRDKKAISECDILVAYIQRPSFGTSMEIFYSYSLQSKYVVVINPNKKYYNDLWLRNHCHRMFSSVGACCKHLKEIISK